MHTHGYTTHIQQAVLGHYELEVGSLLQLPAMIFFESDCLIE